MLEREMICPQCGTKMRVNEDLPNSGCGNCFHASHPPGKCTECDCGSFADEAGAPRADEGERKSPQRTSLCDTVDGTATPQPGADPGPANLLRCGDCNAELRTVTDSYTVCPDCWDGKHNPAPSAPDLGAEHGRPNLSRPTCPRCNTLMSNVTKGSGDAKETWDCLSCGGGQQPARPRSDLGAVQIQCSKWVVCNRDGWPIELTRGRWFDNLIRHLIHGRRLRRWTGTGTFDD